MKHTPIIESTKWTLTTAVSGAAFSYVALWTLDAGGVDVPTTLYQCLPLAFVTGSFGLFYHHQLNKLNTSPAKTGLQASSRAIPLHANGKSSKLMMLAVESIFGVKPVVQPAGLACWQFNGVVIDEMLAYEFYRAGWNRQLLREPHPFSEQWMTKRKFQSIGQRLDSQTFGALVDMTTSFNLWLRTRVQGRSGHIRHNPAGCLARLKGKW